MPTSKSKTNTDKALHNAKHLNLSVKEQNIIKSQLKKDKMLAVVYCKNVLGYSLEESISIINSIK